jgi:hypothetical protein
MPASIDDRQGLSRQSPHRLRKKPPDPAMPASINNQSDSFTQSRRRLRAKRDLSRNARLDR